MNVRTSRPVVMESKICWSVECVGKYFLELGALRYVRAPSVDLDIWQNAERWPVLKRGVLI